PVVVFRAPVPVTATVHPYTTLCRSYSTRIDNTKPLVTKTSIAACYPSVAAAEAAAIGATRATDNWTCSPVLTASTVGDCSATVTVTATDQCGNSGSVSYSTRIDNTKPRSEERRVGKDYPTGAAAEAAAIAETSATDNCTASPAPTATTVSDCSA